jgi:hypothetical protein
LAVINGCLNTAMPTPPLHPNQPRPLPQLNNISQPLDKHTIKPQQRQIQQIATPTLESKSSTPIFQQIEALARVFDAVGADEEV